MFELHYKNFLSIMFELHYKNFLSGSKILLLDLLTEGKVAVANKNGLKSDFQLQRLAVWRYLS